MINVAGQAGRERKMMLRDDIRQMKSAAAQWTSRKQNRDV